MIVIYAPIQDAKTQIVTQDGRLYGGTPAVIAGTLSNAFMAAGYPSCCVWLVPGTEG